MPQKTRTLPELMELWKEQDAFLIANPSYFPQCDGFTRETHLIASMIAAKLDQEIVSTQKGGNTSRVAELEKTKANLMAKIQTSPLPSISDNSKYQQVIETESEINSLN